uniref:Uncharacterized protein n=1 Tax=viral metagenome TaxID=1070528 RepID=A0A6M3J954_9ZZZZ
MTTYTIEYGRTGEVLGYFDAGDPATALDGFSLEAGYSGGYDEAVRAAGGLDLLVATEGGRPTCARCGENEGDDGCCPTCGATLDSCSLCGWIGYHDDGCEESDDHPCSGCERFSGRDRTGFCTLCDRSDEGRAVR